MTKTDWPIKFRRAKTSNTLDIMLDAALRKIESIADKCEAIKGHELRQDELELGRHCKRLFK
ncbi:hypothetical protein [Aeromonas sobria]|jgi:hypothetical protein|uniref:Uncharacterized protein n=1 Tax=Aeromonas sobria TaxID=646 RepID=A0A2N3IN06_AERSO|nr:hypothetical protein [Aeromonas sobria]PKQ72154.1 hypothetical protein CJP16_21790 [Aeromonas sobria]TNI82230.1 hypothetical protein CF119_17160 [Aeromonas sobria]